MPPRRAPRRAADEAGYTLVGLMVAVMVINIMLAAAATSVVTVDRRAREAELIWRGQQIARAIDCFRATAAGEPLERLEQLVQESCLRRLYADPVARDGQWRILTQQDLADGTIADLLGVTQPTPGAPGAGGAAGSVFDRPFGVISGQGDFRSRLRSGPDGIVGVASTAPGESLRMLNGRRRYAEWVFLATGGQ